MTPDLRSLRYFVAVAEQLSFTRAAGRLYIAQQSLSASIRALERQLDVQLFVRSTHRVQLTASGEALLVRARELLSSADELVRDVQREARGERGELRLGVFSAGFAHLTPVLVREFERLHPDMTLTVEAFELARLPEVVPDGEADIAGVWGPIEHPDLEFLPLLEDRAGVFLPAEHPLAHRASIARAELTGETFLILNGCFFSTPAARNHALPTGHERTIPVADGNTALQMISAGRGVGLGALSAAAAYFRPGVAFVPLEDGPPAPLGLCWHRARRTPLLDAFLATAQRLTDDDLAAVHDTPLPVRPETHALRPIAPGR